MHRSRMSQTLPKTWHVTWHSESDLPDDEHWAKRLLLMTQHSSPHKRRCHSLCPASFCPSPLPSWRRSPISLHGQRSPLAAPRLSPRPSKASGIPPAAPQQTHQDFAPPLTAASLQKPLWILLPSILDCHLFHGLQDSSSDNEYPTPFWLRRNITMSNTSLSIFHTAIPIRNRSPTNCKLSIIGHVRGCSLALFWIMFT